MRALQKLHEQAQLMHGFKSRGMDRVTAEVAQEVRMFFENHNIDSSAGKQEPNIEPAGPPPTMQQANCFFSGTGEPFSIFVPSFLTSESGVVSALGKSNSPRSQNHFLRGSDPYILRF